MTVTMTTGVPASRKVHELRHTQHLARGMGKGHLRVGYELPVLSPS